MHRAEPFVRRMFLASLVIAGTAAIARAEPSGNDPSAADRVVPAVAVEQVQVPLLGLREEGAMVLIGSALIGLASAVRRCGRTPPFRGAAGLPAAYSPHSQPAAFERLSKTLD
jgi:hypothetical protein